MLEKIQTSFKKRKVHWRKHILQRMLERKISRKQVIEAVNNGEIIKLYKDDKPFPSILVFGIGEKEALHIVISYDSVNKESYVITVYKPSTEHFERDLKTRKR